MPAAPEPTPAATPAKRQHSLRNLRLAVGKTLTEVGTAVGCSKTGPGSWEIGRYGPHPRQYPKLAAVLGVDITAVVDAVAESMRQRRKRQPLVGSTIADIEAGRVGIRLRDVEQNGWARGQKGANDVES